MGAKRRKRRKGKKRRREKKKKARGIVRGWKGGGFKKPRGEEKRKRG